jgi:hypothetical protein
VSEIGTGALTTDTQPKLATELRDFLACRLPLSASDRSWGRLKSQRFDPLLAVLGVVPYQRALDGKRFVDPTFLKVA